VPGRAVRGPNFLEF